jgi:chitin synthase
MTENICEQLLGTKIWHLYSLRANQSFSLNPTWDQSVVDGQFATLRINSFLKTMSSEFSSSSSIDFFVNRYNLLLNDWEPLDDANKKVFAIMQNLRLASNEFKIVNENVLVSERAWRALEFELAAKSPNHFFSLSNRAYLEVVYDTDDDLASLGNLIRKSSDETHIRHSESTPLKMAPVTKIPKVAETSASRKAWLCWTWSWSFWVPSSILEMFGLFGEERQLAWREKIALCICLVFINALILFFILGLGLVLCPKTSQLSPGEISTFTSIDKGYVYMYGNYYDVSDIAKKHISLSYPTDSATYWESYVLGKDVSSMFSKQQFWNVYCPTFPRPNLFRLFPETLPERLWKDHSAGATLNLLQSKMIVSSKKGPVVWSTEIIRKQLAAAGNQRAIIAYDRYYDISAFFGDQESIPNFMGPLIAEIFSRPETIRGGDMTSIFSELKGKDRELWVSLFTCMDGLFFRGFIDKRNDLVCQVGNYILFGASCVLFAIIFVKFAAAIQLNTYPKPEDSEKFVICLIPCFTENESSLRKAIDSIAATDYKVDRKLLFIVADGMVIGDGNDRPTPRIVLDILGVDQSLDAPTLPFQSTGSGSMQLNFGKVYCGVYQYEQKEVPFIVVVKVGKPSERDKPGNR